ncbi:Glutamyl-tRNA reductase [hydrothermal vent metagenome]|uniref:glutamyl-tRNA reductase n=1 Tax=hydrothermal vent metagenome TaxID=652676 RepID=A0A1W1C4M6_9ZZZZ
MYYQVVSFNYKKCDLEIREKLAFKNNQEKIMMLDRLAHFDFIDEVFIISTCNRIEIVVATKDNFATYHAILGILSQNSGLSFYDLDTLAQRIDDEEAIRHLFSVVSSLDSLVIGESQITGQVKDGFKLSVENGTAGRKLNRIISYAVKCAAEVRNNTQISKNPISIASVAVAQASEIMGDNLAGMTGVVVGAGEMGILASKHLLRAGCDVVLLGRDIEKVKAIAKDLGENVKVDDFNKLHKYLNRYRLLFTATSSSEPIIKQSMVENRDMKRLWFDMAIPRDIEDITVDKLQIYRIDDLQNISSSNHAMRQEQALQANEIVDKYKDDFYKWLRALSVEPIIKGIREQAKDAIDIELQRAIKRGFVPKDYEDNMKKMAEQMFNKFLHKPTVQMRKSSREKEGVNSMDSLKNIFDIDIENVNFKKYKKDHHKGYKS